MMMLIIKKEQKLMMQKKRNGESEAQELERNQYFNLSQSGIFPPIPAMVMMAMVSTEMMMIIAKHWTWL